jgi:hypothetical protein
MTLEQMLIVSLLIVLAFGVLYAFVEWVDRSNPFNHSRRVDNYRSSMRDMK